MSQDRSPPHASGTGHVRTGVPAEVRQPSGAREAAALQFKAAPPPRCRAPAPWLDGRESWVAGACRRSEFSQRASLVGYFGNGGARSSEPGGRTVDIPPLLAPASSSAS